jgi:hypothetical protein
MVPRLAYGMLLACGITVSMLRERARRGRATVDSRRRRAVRIALTITYIAVIRVFVQPGAGGIGERAHLILGLLAIGR